MTCGCPSRSSPDTVMLEGRTTVAVNPGTLRQPSSSSCVPSRASTFGLMTTRRSSARRPSETSTTKMRSGTPTCGAARPTPGAAYIVRIMSSTSWRISGVTSETGAAGRCTVASPYLTIGRIIRLEVGGRSGLRGLGVRRLGTDEPRADRRGRRVDGVRDVGDVVGAELLEEGIGQHETHHRLADDGSGRHGADVAAFNGRGRFLERDEIDRPQRLHQGGNRLHVGRDAQFFTVGDAAF